MALYLRQRWRRQPQGAVQVDWANPLARGLIALATPSNSLLQTVAPGSSFAGSANRSTGATGVAWSFNGTSTGISAAQSASPTIATLYAFANFPSQAGPGTFVALGTASSNRYVVMDLIGSDLRVLQNNGSVGGFMAFSVPVGRWVHYASVHASSGNVVYVDGIQFASGSGGGLPISTTFDVGALFQGGFSNRGIGAIAVAAAWGRALSEAEHKTLSENPWQLFRAPKPILYSLPTNYSRPVQDVYNPNNNTTGNASKIIGAVAQFLPRRWRQQPQGAVQVDWGNPLAREVSFAASPSTGGIASPDAVSGMLPESLGTNVNITGTSAGRALTFSTGGNFDFPTRLKPLEGASKITVDCLIYLPDNPGTDVHIFGQWTTLVSWLFLRRNNRFAFAWGQTPASGAAGGAYESNIAQGGISNNKWTHVAFVWDAGTGRYDFYFDGASPGASNNWFGSIPLTIQATTDPVRLGGNAAFTGSIATVRTWKRALSASEIAALSENPWQLFKPRKQIIYVPQTGWTRIP